MKKSLSHSLRSGMLAATVVVLLGAPAHAVVACGNYQPGMLAFMTGTRPAPCAYQGDTMVNQGPAYTGPARIAPQPTYAPTRTAADYPYVHGQFKSEPAPAVKAAPVRKRAAPAATVKRVVKGKPSKRMVVNVKSDLPPRKGKVQIVHARAEVRIYGPERMDIRLYRR